MLGKQVKNEDKNVTLLERLRIEVKLKGQNSKKQQMFLIYNYLADTNDCIEVTVRKFLQVEHLVQEMSERYGGFVIPVLDINNTFSSKQTPETLLLITGEYLNELVQNIHCSRDPKLYQFLLMQEVHFPNIERFDKLLSDAAVLSRRYLNTIFTRKESQPSQTEFEAFIETHRVLVKATFNFTQLVKFLETSSQQQEVLQELFGTFHDIVGGLGYGIQPIEFTSPRMRKNIKRFSKILVQAEEAFMRWEILNETVRELQCNLYKGLHEDNAYYEAKAKQLREWAKTLNLDFLQIINKAGELMSSVSKKIRLQKKEQFRWNQISQQNTIPSQ